MMTNTNTKIKYYGFYRGKVVQCLNNGFCRIWIPDILDCPTGDINSLPPAEPAQPIGGGGMTNNGKFMYPELNSIVWCFFEGGNLERPVYFATSDVKSEIWSSISVKTTKNKNRGNDGTSMFPAGVITKFNKTEIKQTSVIDPNTGKPESDEIKISVKPITELENLYNQAEVDLNDKTIIPTPVAGSIRIDNMDNVVEIIAKNEIVLRAPKITLDTSGAALNGQVNIHSHDTSFLSDSDGHFRVIGPHVNIDGTKNAIVLQSENDIRIDKNKVVKQSSNKEK